MAKQKRMSREQFLKKKAKEKYSTEGMVIYCRHIQEARRVAQLFFKKKHYTLNDKGHIIVEKKFANAKEIFTVKSFWSTCGYYPILIGTRYMNKNKYNEIIPNSIKFIHKL